MTSPFPLLLVPYVPLRRIIDFMEPDALVSLSFCSQKSHFVIKTLRKTPHDERLHVGGSNITAPFLSLANGDCVLSTGNSAYISSFEKEEYVKLGGQKVRVKMHRLVEYLITYWEDKLYGLKAITDYVADLFIIDVSEVYISKDSFEMIEWVNRRQKTPLKKVVLDWGLNPSEDEINYILRDCQCSSEILIYSKAPPNFRFSNNFRRIDCLDISNSEWVTIDNLLTMDGIDIHLDNASLTNTDFNVFLKHWLSGGCPRLKLFCAESDSLDILQVLDGLLHNAVLVEGSRDYTSPFGYRRILSFGFDIQRVDGVTATVCDQGNGTLIIAIWPETTYNYN